MQANRSLKDLFVTEHKFQSPFTHCQKNISNFSHIKLNLQNHVPIHQPNIQSKLSKSQTNLFQTLHHPVKSPQQRIACKLPTPNNVLTPIHLNGIQPHIEPKKPKILKRSKVLNFQEQFKLGKVLGQGKFGNVYIIEHYETRTLFAAKQISLEKLSKKLISRIIAEIKIQFYLQHQNCLQLYKFYKEDQNIYLILELGDQSLFDLLRIKKFFSERKTAYYIKQTIQALIYLHQNGIIHRDLKPENIVLINDVVKLADFGWSIYTGKKQKRKTFCGTLDYVSPEIVMGQEYNEMVDVWGLGILCYELCTGHAPFEEAKTKQEAYKKILNVQMKFPKHLSHKIKDFIKKLLMVNPEERMSLKQALEHEWIREYGSYRNS